MNIGRVIGIALIMVLVLLAACAPTAAPTPAPAPQVPAPAIAPAVVPLTSVKPAWELEWEKTVEAAKREGVVVFACGLGPLVARNMSAAFKEKYGIQVESSAASTTVLIPKLLAERKAGIYLWDALMAGGAAQVSSFKPTGATAPLEPVLILPDLTDPEVIKKVWYDGKLSWIDRDHHLIRTLLQVGQDLVINTELVKPGEIQSWDDVLNPKWKGKIGLLDPTVSGTGTQQALFPMFYEVKGEAWVRKLAAQEPVITSDDRLGLDWLAHGKYPIYTSPRGDNLQRYLEAGAPIAFVATKDVMKVGARAGVLSLLAKAPHPNAAKIFVNWLLSKEGVTIQSRDYGGLSPRLDVPTDFLRPEQLRKPGFNYFNEDTEEVGLKVPDYTKKSIEIFGYLKK